MNGRASEDSLEARIEAMEKRHRAERRLLVMVGLLLSLYVVIKPIGECHAVARGGRGIQSPKEELPEGRFSSVTTQEFQLIDDKGRLRAILGFSSEPHSGRTPVGLSLLDETGESRLALSAGSAIGPDLSISRAGAGTVRVGMNGTSPIVQLIDDEGKMDAALWFMNGSPHLVLTDHEGKTRAILGYESGWSAGKGPEKRIPSTMALYDQRGKVIWSATPDERNK